MIVNRSDEQIAAANVRVIVDRNFARRLGMANQAKARSAYDQRLMLDMFARLYGLRPTTSPSSEGGCS